MEYTFNSMIFNDVTICQLKNIEIYEKNKTITDQQTILMTDYALRQCSAKRLSSKERIELASIITEQAKLHNDCLLFCLKGIPYMQCQE